MTELLLFTDASVNSKTGIGYGAFLSMRDMTLPLATLQAMVKVKQFEHTSSTKLELQTLLWALTDIEGMFADKTRAVTLYTDSQNIVGLRKRRDQLVLRDYVASSGKRLSNSELYQEFYAVIDRVDCEIVKVAGHKAKQDKNDIERVFEVVDRASRAALREFDRHQKIQLPWI